MIAAVIASIMLVIATILTLYETLRLTSERLAGLPLPPRARIIVVVLAAFVGHTLAVWTYALGYWVLSDRLGGSEPERGREDTPFAHSRTSNWTGMAERRARGRRIAFFPCGEDVTLRVHSEWHGFRIRDARLSSRQHASTQRTSRVTGTFVIPPGESAV